MKPKRRAAYLLFGLSTLLASTAGGFGVGVAGEAAPGAGSATTGAPAKVPAVLPAGRTYTVTLLTGDVVTVTTRATGCPQVSVKPAKPDGFHSTSCGPDGHVQVVPGSVAPLVGRTLDEELFDVTTLISEGYDDARSREIPLIVRSAGSVAKATSSLTDGLTRQRALPSIGAVAGRQAKAKPATFTKAIAGLSAASAVSGTQVWLDHQVRATALAATATAPVLAARATGLDANLRQVGAPQAWRAGYTGKDVRVAVLDTGVDSTHPDLTGKVAEKVDFTVDGGDAVDRQGHGTHVAATALGTGAGSGGARRGVAPEASLLVGKVLGDDGWGSTSQIVAGMEWAAPRARVVNMSLGGGISDGTDPLSQAVDALTEEHGTLFVVSAGNTGPTDSVLGAPAAAASALTVGAVDSADRLAEFSSRGPLLNTHAAKPEIVAPGVGIVAARAAGTTMGRPIDGHYTAASGTSMAAPHVAGAAAVLAEAHPDWRAEQLKAALVGAAEAVPGEQPYAVGAGRLNAARALGAVVSGQAVINLGTFAHPQSGTAETKLSWTNTGTTATTLTLTVTATDRQGRAAPAGAVSLSDSALPIGAGASGGAMLRIDRGRFAAAPGLYSATVTAQSGTGTIRTPIAFHVEPPAHQLTVNLTPPPGAAADSEVFGSVTVANLDDSALFYANERVTSAPLRLRVPAGRYSVMGEVHEVPAGSSDIRRSALAGDPDVTVTSDAAVTLDAAAAKPVTATVDGVATEQTNIVVAFTQTSQGELVSAYNIYTYGLPASDHSLYATPSQGVGVGTFQAYAGFALAAPGDEPNPFRYDLVKQFPGRLPDDPTYRVTAVEHVALGRIDQRFYTLDQPDDRTEHRRVVTTPEGLVLDQGDFEEVPATRTDYVSPGMFWSESVRYKLGEELAGVVEPEYQYAPGSRQQKTWVRQPLRPDWYDAAESSPSFCLPDPISRTRGDLAVQFVDLTDQHQRFNCLNAFAPNSWTEQAKRTLALYQNGQKVGEYQDAAGHFTIPQQAATYRLTYDVDASALLPVSTRVNTAWTFRSAGPADSSSVPVPLLSVDYELPLDEGNRSTGGEAGFVVHQALGTAKQNVTSFSAWVSTDDGTTWTAVPVQRVAGGRFSAQLPTVAAGQAVSLRITAGADGGSQFEQTIIRAYQGR